MAIVQVFTDGDPTETILTRSLNTTAPQTGNDKRGFPAAPTQAVEGAPHRMHK
ncbi:MAG: hypothetical protein R3C24_12875 [Cyanobacteriota/Melainabacteria group bacterium]